MQGYPTGYMIELLLTKWCLHVSTAWAYQKAIGGLGEAESASPTMTHVETTWSLVFRSTRRSPGAPCQNPNESLKLALSFGTQNHSTHDLKVTITSFSTEPPQDNCSLQIRDFSYYARTWKQTNVTLCGYDRFGLPIQTDDLLNEVGRGDWCWNAPAEFQTEHALIGG